MKDNKELTPDRPDDPDVHILFNVLKYSFILQYLLKIDSFFINEYKIKLFKNLILISNNYSNLLTLNNKELNKELNKIINTYFNKLIT